MSTTELLWLLAGLVLASIGITLLREQVPWPWGALLIAFALVCLPGSGSALGRVVNAVLLPDLVPGSPEWRPIPSCPGYEASSDGRIRSLKRGRAHILAAATSDTHGRIRFQNWLAGGYRWQAVHSAVAEAFYGPRPEGMEVRHLDGDHRNNAVSNLSYGTRSENMLDRVRHGTHHCASKTHCKNGHPFDPANTYRSAAVRLRARKQAAA